jgi:hypothetical protein
MPWTAVRLGRILSTFFTFMHWLRITLRDFPLGIVALSTNTKDMTIYRNGNEGSWMIDVLLLSSARRQTFQRSQHYLSNIAGFTFVLVGSRESGVGESGLLVNQQGTCSEV